MKFKLDENLPTELASDLREMGHDAHTVSEEGLSGQPDPVIVAAAATEQRILLTLDKGIARLTEYPPHELSGIILFRPDATGRKAVRQFVCERLPELLTLGLAGRLAVVGTTRIRIR